jgi:putative nucleic acid modification protein with dual OB domain
MAPAALVHDAVQEVTLTQPPLLVNNGAAVPEHVAVDGVDASLALVAPTRLRIGHGPEAHPSAPGARALFVWAGAERNFPISDFVVGPRVRQRPQGLYAPEDLDLPAESKLRLTVSLGAPHEAWCYKLVAAIVPLP